MVSVHLNNNLQSSSKWLFILLFIVVVLTIWTASQNDSENTTDVVELAERPASAGINKPTVLKALQRDSVNEKDVSTWAIPWHELKREPLKVKDANLFKVHSWVVVPPVKKIKAALPLLPPPPVAPPAPFIYMGKLEDTPKDTPKNTQIFLMANDRLYSTKLGEKIDQQWRLDMEEANALRLTYLPLNLPQVLSKNARPVIAPIESLPVAENNL